MTKHLARLVVGAAAVTVFLAAVSIPSYLISMLINTINGSVDIDAYQAFMLKPLCNGLFTVVDIFVAFFVICMLVTIVVTFYNVGKVVINKYNEKRGTK